MAVGQRNPVAVVKFDPATLRAIERLERVLTWRNGETPSRDIQGRLAEVAVRLWFGGKAVAGPIWYKGRHHPPSDLVIWLRTPPDGLGC
jgi:hypothetical protein